MDEKQGVSIWLSGILPHYVLPDAVEYGSGFYSVMLTSTILGLITMVLFKPRSWCVYCPMGTMTQLICKGKNGKK